MNEILLSIGHGGSDPGSVGSKYTEHDLMTIMTNSLGNKLEELAEVKVTIVDEKDKNGKFLNSYPDIAIKHSNHGNGSTDKSANGAEIIIDNNSGATKLCSNILRVLENHGIRNRGIKHNENLYVLNYNEMLGKDFNHILEWGFITNDADVAKLLDNKDKITTEIANLYIEYYGWTRKEEETIDMYKQLEDKFSKALLFEDKDISLGGRYQVKAKHDIMIRRYDTKTKTMKDTGNYFVKGRKENTDFFMKEKGKDGKTRNYHALVNKSRENHSIDLICIDVR